MQQVPTVICEISGLEMWSHCQISWMWQYTLNMDINRLVPRYLPAVITRCRGCHGACLMWSKHQTCPQKHWRQGWRMTREVFGGLSFPRLCMVMEMTLIFCMIVKKAHNPRGEAKWPTPRLGTPALIRSYLLLTFPYSDLVLEGVPGAPPLKHTMLVEPSHVRTLFPETWIWDDAVTGFVLFWLYLWHYAQTLQVILVSWRFLLY